MCLSIVKTPNARLSRSTLKNGYSNNPHGAGYAYALNDEIFMEKGFFSFNSFYKAFLTIPEEAPALIHFRLASHGEINAYNCHPWKINDDFVMIHNGILSDFGDAQTSDSGQFAELILKPLFDSLKNPREDFQSPWLKYLINETIGSWNKISVLSRWGDLVTYQEKTGFWVGGCWHSNSCGFSTNAYFSRRADEEDKVIDINVEEVMHQTVTSEDFQ